MTTVLLGIGAWLAVNSILVAVLWAGRRRPDVHPDFVLWEQEMENA